MVVGGVRGLIPPAVGIKNRNPFQNEIKNRKNKKLENILKYAKKRFCLYLTPMSHSPTFDSPPFPTPFKIFPYLFTCPFSKVFHARPLYGTPFEFRN